MEKGGKGRRKRKGNGGIRKEDAGIEAENGGKGRRKRKGK